MELQRDLPVHRRETVNVVIEFDPARPVLWRMALRRIQRALPALALVGLVILAILVKRQAPWVPSLYLGGLLAVTATPRLLLRWRCGPPRSARIGGAVACGVIGVSLLPVPWMTAQDASPGTAWKLDGNLTVNGQTMNPAGEWYWLTVGRPPMVIEVVGAWMTSSPAPVDLRQGQPTRRPSASEPAAAAVGLRAAGFAVADGEVEAMVGGMLAGTPAGHWFRGLALGRSHGMMVALVTYATVGGEDLGRGRSIAGTGAIESDGTIRPIGGLVSKATAAVDAGADILLFPASQADELASFDPRGMLLIPVSTLDEAIASLRE